MSYHRWSAPITESSGFRSLQLWVQMLLAKMGTVIFPAVLVTLTGVVLLWRLGHVDIKEGQSLPLLVWMQPEASGPLALSDVAAQLQTQTPQRSVETRLSLQTFWFALDSRSIPATLLSAPVTVEVPSRHTMELECWDRVHGTLQGRADRRSVTGNLQRSRAGFSIGTLDQTLQNEVLCKVRFRGPAKLSAIAWEPQAQAVEQAAYLKTGTLIEAGIGVLAIIMLLTAVVNRSVLYWTFAGWLLLNMRMAAISAGTDFSLFGLTLDPTLLIESRKWTVCMYFSMTAALFSLLFQDELRAIRAGLALLAAQLAAVVLVALCLFLSFERMLVLLWFSTALGMLVILYYLIRILRHNHSRMAWWYAASIAVTLLASFNEVLAASLGQQSLMLGLNSVTAAIASALLASAAVAEHLRADRLQKIEAQQTLQAAYEDSPVGLFTMDEDAVLLKANPAFAAMVLGLDPAQTGRVAAIFGDKVAADLLSLGKAQKRSLEIQAKVVDPRNQAERWFSIRASTVDGSITEGSLQDITERVIATERLEFLANHDPLTECLNLRGIARRFDRQARKPTALAYFDLDRFKLINDLYGHIAGDNVLKQVCERMKSALGAQDLLSRVGGDEFVIAFENASIAQATAVCEQIVQLIATAPYQIGHQRFALNVSGGLVGTERFDKSALKEIISAADTLCRLAKKRTDRRLIVMESDDRFFRHHKEELEVISFLERGEAPKGLFLVMQPEISLVRPFDSLNFEILLRMRKQDGTVVPAGIVIEAAEMHGKTAIIDRWVIQTAIEWVEANAASLRNTRFVSVNLSGGSLNDEAFTEELFAYFENHPVALSLICIEITESVALTDMRNVQRFIDRIRSLGGKVALDDFGAGYSSFGYLKGLSVDALKLDGSLVKDATQSPAGLAIIDALGSLVSNLGMKSIGEYAENLPTIKALVSAGIDYAQGYGISKPVMPERILQARCSADFIEDPEILAYMQEIQSQESSTMSLFELPDDASLH